MNNIQLVIHAAKNNIRFFTVVCDLTLTVEELNYLAITYRRERAFEIYCKEYLGQ